MSSNDPKFSSNITAAIREEAARWVVRRDRGFSGSEDVEYEDWLDLDPRHNIAMARSRLSWDMLDELPESLTSLRPEVATLHPMWLTARFGGFAAAAALTLLIAGSWWLNRESLSNGGGSAVAEVSLDEPRTLILSDNTLVRLNVGASILEKFTENERRVYLESGEAHFTVTKNSDRPFIVHAGDVMVRAVGTAFNVYMEEQGVDVLVTEGKVHVDTLSVGGNSSSPESSDPLRPARGASFVVAGQRASVAFPSSAKRRPIVFVSDASLDDVSQALAWRESLLRLGGASLEALAQDFEKKTGRRLVLADSSLANLQIGGRFPSDDIEGFVHLLETNYGIESEIAADGVIVLGKSH